jgi:hypothetical protein
MSSARANASARNRRAGGDMPPQPQMPGRPGQPMQQQMQQQMQPPAKLSISDAIALITLRLGRLEQIVQNMPVDAQSGLAQDGENIRIVDDSVFESIVQRLDVLEKGHQVLASRKPEVVQVPIKTQVTSPVPTPLAPTISKEVTESIEVLKAEVVQLKDLLLNLQAFTMQTNHRLSEMVFSENNFLEIDCEESANNAIISENIEAGINSIVIEEGDSTTLEELAEEHP